MKTYVPDRSGGAVPGDRTAPRSPMVRDHAGVRWWLTGVSALGLAGGLAFSIADGQRLRSRQVAAVDGWRSAEASLKREIESQAAAITATTDQRDQARHQVSELTSKVTETTALLTAAEKRSATLRQESERQTLELQAALDPTRKLQHATGTELVAIGTELNTDPAVAIRLLNRAAEFSRGDDDLSRLIAAAKSMLPSSMPVSSGSKVKVLSCQSDERSLVIDVSVVDQAGKHLSGMSRIDFEVFDADRRLHAVACSERLLTFDDRDIAVLLDASASTAGPASLAMREGASALVQKLTNPSRLKIVRFGDDVQSLSPWTIDPQLHLQAIDSIRPAGGTALYKALGQATDDLRNARGLRAIILFTDGRDSSGSDSIRSIIDRCRTSAIPITIVALQTRETDEGVLQRLAAETGGSLHTIRDAADIPSEFERVAESFQRPSYRLRILESVASGSLTLRVGTLPPIKLRGP